MDWLQRHVVGRQSQSGFFDLVGLGLRRLRFLRRLGVIPTLSGSTLTMALRASWNVNGWSDTGLAFGTVISHGLGVAVVASGVFLAIKGGCQ